jgi:N-methylhydantoinase B
MYGLPVVGGIMYRDSIEIDELKHPIHIRSLRLLTDTGGAGRFRGAPACEMILGPKRDLMTVIIPCDMQENPPRGVQGGLPGAAAATWRIDKDETEQKLPNFVTVQLEPGTWLRGRDNGGGGYGLPFERDPHRVLNDVIEGFVSVESAAEVYGVVLKRAANSGDWIIDQKGTEMARTRMMHSQPRPVALELT